MLTHLTSITEIGGIVLLPEPGFPKYTISLSRYLSLRIPLSISHTLSLSLLYFDSFTHIYAIRTQNLVTFAGHFDRSDHLSK